MVNIVEMKKNRKHVNMLLLSRIGGNNSLSSLPIDSGHRQADKSSIARQ